MSSVQFGASAAVLWMILLTATPTDTALLWWTAAIGAPLNTAGFLYTLVRRFR